MPCTRTDELKQLISQCQRIRRQVATMSRLCLAFAIAGGGVCATSAALAWPQIR